MFWVFFLPVEKVQSFKKGCNNMVCWRGFFPQQSVIQETRFLLHNRLNYVVLKISKLFSSIRNSVIKAKLLFFCACGRIAQMICSDYDSC